MKTNENDLSRNLADLVLWFCFGLLLAEAEEIYFFLLAGVGLFFLKKGKVEGIYLAQRLASLACGVFLLWFVLLPQQNWGGLWEKTVEVKGEIVQYQQGKSYCVLQVKELNKEKLHLQPKLAVYLPKNDIHVFQRGQVIKLNGKLVQPEPAVNPGGFDGEAYWRSQGVFALLWSTQADILIEPQGIVKLAAKIQQELENKLKNYLPQAKVNLLWAILFGEKQLLEDGFYEKTQKLGIAHIFAVSGLHVGFILNMLLGILCLMRSERKPLALLLVAVIISFYCFMVGLTPSALRATIMGILTLLAQYFFKRRDSYTLLAASALVVLLVQPFALWSAGFQLSYGVTFGILYLYPLTLQWCSFLKFSALRNTCAVALAAQLSSLPLIAWYFYYVSAYGLFLNIALVPLMGLIIPILLLALLFSIILPPLANACFGLTSLMLDIMTFSINGVTSLLGTGEYYIGKPTGIALLVYLFCLVSLRQGWYPKIKQEKIFVLLAGMGLLLLWLPLPPAVTELTYLDVGQGSSAVLRTKNGEVYVFDCGVKSDDTANYLAYCGVNTVDGIILSHADSDHSGGLAKIIQNFTVKKLYLEEHQVQREELALEGLPVASIKKNQSVKLKQGSINLVPFDHGDTEDNGCQLVAIIDYKDWKIVFPGDAGLTEIEQIAKLVKEVDIWTVPHHGSRYSGNEKSYAELAPKIAVISAGKGNLYGHPHQEILTILDKYAEQIYRTDKNGVIKFRLP